MAVVKDFEIDGYRAIIYKHDSLGHLCGYIGLPKDHHLHGKHYDDENVPHDVHGGWTYSEAKAPGTDADGLWYLGFDCAHAGDAMPGFEREGDVYRDEQFVETELRNALPTLLEKETA